MKISTHLNGSKEIRDRVKEAKELVSLTEEYRKITLEEDKLLNGKLKNGNHKK